MKQIINVDLTTKTTDWTPPVLTFGEDLTLACYFTKDVSGNSTVPNFTFTSAKAALGLVDARPTGGEFCLQLGPNPGTWANITTALQANDSAAHVAAAINALTGVVAAYGECAVQKVSGSWLLHFGDGTQEVQIQVVNNGLWPISAGNVNAWQVNNKWVHELRLAHGPLSFFSTSTVVLVGANPPSVTRIRGGETLPDGGLLDELQQLNLPADFTGAYVINNPGTGTSTAQISPTAGPADIQAALVAAFGAGITVTLPLSYNFLIDFGGQFAGAPQAQLTISVVQAPPGALTVTLPLDTAELNSALRGSANGTVTVPLMLSMDCAEDGGPTQTIVAFSIPVTIQRTLLLPALELSPQINWNQPFSPVSYTPFGAQNILTAGQAYAANQPPAPALSFALTHGLATEDVWVFVRDNSSGRLLALNQDYFVTVNSANQVTVTAGVVTVTASTPGSPVVAISSPMPQALVAGIGLMGSTVSFVSGTNAVLNALAGVTITTPTQFPLMPQTNQWRVVVYSSWSVAQWANGLTVTEAQVQPGLTGATLVNDLENIQANLASLNTLLPGAASTGANGSSSAPAYTISFPTNSGFLFARDNTGKPITAAASLPAGGAFLLPAINNTATPTSFTALPLPASTGSAGTVWQNNTSGPLQIPVSGRIRGGWCPASGYFGSDGRTLYPLTRSGSTDSWFPKPFELTLWEAYINDKMFPAQTTLTAVFGLALQLVNADTECQWVVVIEAGTLVADASGSSFDATNLGSISWNTATPLLRQQLILTSNLETHGLGCTITQVSGTIGVASASGTSVTLSSATLPANFGLGSLLLGRNVAAISGTAVTLSGNANPSVGSTTGVVFTTLTANALIYQRILNANTSAPPSPIFALRARLINFDTKDSVPWAKGWVSWALVNPTSGTAGITIV